MWHIRASRWLGVLQMLVSCLHLYSLNTHHTTHTQHTQHTQHTHTHTHTHHRPRADAGGNTTSGDGFHCGPAPEEKSFSIGDRVHVTAKGKNLGKAGVVREVGKQRNGQGALTIKVLLDGQTKVSRAMQAKSFKLGVSTYYTHNIK